DPLEAFTSAAQLAASLRSFRKRHELLASEKAKQAAREKAAYRRGILRATTLAVTVVAAFAILAAYAYHKAQEQEHQRQLAEEANAQLAEALARLQTQKAEELFSTDNAGTAVAYLARTLRQYPTNRIALDRLL